MKKKNKRKNSRTRLEAYVHPIVEKIIDGPYGINYGKVLKNVQVGSNFNTLIALTKNLMAVLWNLPPGTSLEKRIGILISIDKRPILSRLVSDLNEDLVENTLYGITTILIPRYFGPKLGPELHATLERDVSNGGLSKNLAKILVRAKRQFNLNKYTISYSTDQPLLNNKGEQILLGDLAKNVDNDQTAAIQKAYACADVLHNIQYKVLHNEFGHGRLFKAVVILALENPVKSLSWVAKKCRIEPGTVHQYMHRFKQRLRKKYNVNFDDKPVIKPAA